MTPHSPCFGRSRLRTILINVGILILLSALLEAAVRVRAVIKHGFAGEVEDILTIDQDLKLRVPIAGRTLGPININSLGFRGPEIPATKPRGTIRLAFLGASTTFGAEVSSNEATWPNLVWRRFQQEFPGQSFDYINGGVPGYGLDSSLKNLMARVAPLRPDVIVIYDATNDLSANSYALAKAQGLISERPDRQRSWLARYSLLVYLIEVNLNIAKNQRAAGTETRRLTIDAPRLAAPFRADMVALLAAAKATAPVVAVGTFATQFREDQPQQQQLKGASTSLYYMPYMSMAGLLKGFAVYNEVIRELARAVGVVLIESADVIPGDPAHFRDSVHFTDSGSAAMAKVVSDTLIASPEFQSLLHRDVPDSSRYPAANGP